MKVYYLIAFLIISSFQCGCATVNGFKEDIGLTKSEPAAIPIKTEVKENDKKQKTTKIPPNSPFSKISVGMSSKQMTDLIGQPNDIFVFTTGKSYIPFYHGKDRIRTVYYYKNQGRITVSQTHRVVSIDYDTLEDGYH